MKNLLPSDYQQTIDALLTELDCIRKERDRLREILEEVYINCTDQELVDFMYESYYQGFESEDV